MTRSNSIAAFFLGIAALMLLSSAAYSDRSNLDPLTRKVRSVKVERVPGMPGLVRITAITIANSTGYTGARLRQSHSSDASSGNVVLKFHLNTPKSRIVGWAMVTHKAVVVIQVPKGTKTIQVNAQTNQITVRLPAA
jgi:hypothetical protein